MCEYESPFFDAKNDNAMPPKSPEIAAQSDLLTEKTWNTARSAQGRSRKKIPQRQELCDVTDTYPQMEPDAETTRNSRLRVRPTPAVRNTYYGIFRSLIALKNTDNNSCAALVCSTERIRGRAETFRNALRNQNVAMQKLVIFCFGYPVLTNSLTTQSSLFQNTSTDTKFSSFIHTSRIHVIHFFSFFFFFSQNFQLLCIYNKYNEEGKNGFILLMKIQLHNTRI